MYIFFLFLHDTSQKRFSDNRNGLTETEFEPQIKQDALPYTILS